MTLYLVALAVAQTIAGPGKVARFDLADFHNIFGKRSWSKLIGSDGRSQVRDRQHVVAALKRLAQYNLVQSFSPNGWMKWKLLQEDGSRRVYKVPKTSENDWLLLQIPVSFWLMGWTYLLTDSEKALYIMLLDASQRMPDVHEIHGVGLAESVRRGEYGITDEVYAATYELEEFGLIRRMPSANKRRAGRLSQSVLDDVNAGRVTLGVERFQILDNLDSDSAARGTARPAAAVIEQALTASKKPPRFDNYANWDEEQLKDLSEVIERGKRRRAANKRT